MVTAFADYVALAVEHARNEHNRHLLAVYSGSDRIARDLHDHVIQRIFAVGLALQSAQRRLADEAMAERIGLAINDLDTTIADIRSLIFSLQHGARPDHAACGPRCSGSPRTRRRCSASSHAWCSRSHRHDRAHRAGGDDAAMRESLFNAARHARADDVAAGAGRRGAKTLTIRVEDNGVSPNPSRWATACATPRLGDSAAEHT